MRQLPTPAAWRREPTPSVHLIGHLAYRFPLNHIQESANPRGSSRTIREAIYVDGRPMTRKHAVDGMRFNETMLGRIETGQNGFRVKADLVRLLKDKYEVTDEELIEHLVNLNSDDKSADDWVTRFRSHMSPGMTSFVGIEAEAKVIRLYHPTNVHGLLQTESYARRIYEIGKPIEETTTEFIRTHVALRLERKRRVLQRQPEPVRVRAILGEAAVRATVGSPEIMRQQWEESAMLSRLDHVQIQVLPLEEGHGIPGDPRLRDTRSGARAPPAGPGRHGVGRCRHH